MHLNICDDELRHLVCCWVSADLLANHNWRLLLVWLLCLLSSFGTGRIFATDIFVGVFPDEAQQLVFCKEPQKSSPAALSHFSQKKKKIPSSATINAKVNQSVSLLRSFFYIPLSWCLASLLSSDWPELSLSLFILGITTKTDAALLFLSCTRRSLLYFTPFYSH